MRPRRQVYTLDMYLKNIKNGYISNNADVQRKFIWTNEQINELVVTVLTDDYIPPIILGEEDSAQLYIVDGGQRSRALDKFRYGNHKITSAIGNSVIRYKKKGRDEHGKIIWEEAEFDIKNKTYEKLPEELKKKFNEYQVDTVIHESCDMHMISQYIKRYNNHTAMNGDQKAFVHLDHFAACIREMLDRRFFLDCSDFSENDKAKGVLERVVVETVMCSNYLSDWKKQTKAACKYLNVNATKKNFEDLSNNLGRLEAIITDDIKDIFNKKDSFIFLTLFDRFTKLGMEDVCFAKFLKQFKNNWRNNKVNGDGILFDELDNDKSTKDKAVVVAKLEMLIAMLQEFLHISETYTDIDDTVAFISEMIGEDSAAVCEDLDCYNETLDTLTSNTIRYGSKLLDAGNRSSLLAMVAYSYKEDVDLDDWMAGYAERNDRYQMDQKQNFLKMKRDFERYCNIHDRTSA